MNRIKLQVISLLLLFLNPCIILLIAANVSGFTFPENQSKDKVLARVGPKEITIKEFLERGELTIRPVNFKDKYITLNNLITEKILALEAGKNKKISENLILKGTVKGIKEQAMRDKLYDKIAFSKIKLDSAELKNAYKASLREYEVEFYMLKNKELVNNIETIFDTIPELSDEVFKELEKTIDKRPVRKVSFKDKDDDIIHESLFSNPLDTGTVVGPIKLTNGNYILMKVLNWVDYPIIGGQAEQWEKVKQAVHEIKARKLWLGYQTQLMKGKRFEFDNNSFNALADAAIQYYINNLEDDSLKLLTQEIPGNLNININPNAPFFTVNNKLWSVSDFKNEILSHPLVYRTKHLDKHNFKRQFQLAVVDMMRDYFLNQEAYKDSLDKSDDITRIVNIWKDSFFATAEMNRVIKSALEQMIISKDNNPGMLKYKESYISNLQKKYDNMISINFKEFERISLTNVDFLAIRPGVPFPNATPAFPLLIRSGNLDYGKGSSSVK